MAKKFQFEDGRAYTKELRSKKVKDVYFNKTRNLEKLYDKAGDLFNSWCVAFQKKEKPLAFVRLWVFVNYAIQLKEVPEYNTAKWKKRKGRMTGKVTKSIDFLEQLQLDLEQKYNKDKANYELYLKDQEKKLEEQAKLEEERKLEEEKRRADASKPRPATIDLNVFQNVRLEPSAPPPIVETKNSPVNDWGNLRAPKLEEANQKFSKHLKDSKYVVHDPNAPTKVYTAVKPKPVQAPKVKNKPEEKTRPKPVIATSNIPSAPLSNPSQQQPVPNQKLYNTGPTNRVPAMPTGYHGQIPMQQPYNYPVNPNGMAQNPIGPLPIYAHPNQVPQYPYRPPNTSFNQPPPQQIIAKPLKPKPEQKTAQVESKKPEKKRIGVNPKGKVTDSGFIKIVGTAASQFDYPGGSNACLCCSLTFLATAFRLSKVTDLRTSPADLKTLLKAMIQEGVNKHVMIARKKGLPQDRNRALDEVSDFFDSDFQKVEGVFGAVGKPQDETDGAGFAKVVPWFGAKYGPNTGFHLICDGGAYAWFTNSSGQVIYFDSHRRDPKSGLLSPNGGACLVWFKNHYALTNYLHALFGGNPAKAYEICISEKLEVHNV